MKFRHITIIVLLMLCSNTNGQSLKTFHPIYKDSTGYSGGMDWIINQSSDIDFLLFGEQHGVAGIPNFVLDTYKRIKEKGFDNLVLEIDPMTGEMLHKMGVDAFMEKYPHNLAFDYDGDIGLLREFLEDGESRVWGVDQPITAIHVFEMLEKISISANTRRLCRALFLKSALKRGEFIKENHKKDLQLLKDAFLRENNGSAVSIIDQLIASMEIFMAYRAGRAGKISPQVSVNLRENLMKSHFDDFLDSKKHNSKTILKMGGAHTAYGIGPNGIQTLGGHIADYAKKANAKVLSIGIFNHPKKAVFGKDSIFNGGVGVLIDCKAMQKSMDSTYWDDLPKSFLPNLSYFDAVIYFNNAPRDKRTIMGPLDNGFKNRIVKILAMGGILSLIGLSALIVLIFQKNRNRPLYIFSGLLPLAFFVPVLSILLKFPMQGIVLPSTSLIWYLLLAIAYLSLTALTLSKSRTRTHKEGIKLYDVVLLLVNGSLLYYLFYWNMLGMMAWE